MTRASSCDLPGRPSRATLILTFVVWLVAVPIGDRALAVNLLNNASFESDTHGGDGQWKLAGGNWGRLYDGGKWYYYCPGITNGSIYQEIDLAALGYDSHRLETGGYYATFGSSQASYEEYFIIDLPNDIGQVTLKQLPGSGQPHCPRCQAAHGTTSPGPPGSRPAHRCFDTGSMPTGKRASTTMRT